MQSRSASVFTRKRRLQPPRRPAPAWAWPPAAHVACGGGAAAPLSLLRGHAWPAHAPDQRISLRRCWRRCCTHQPTHALHKPLISTAETASAPPVSAGMLTAVRNTDVQQPAAQAACAQRCCGKRCRRGRLLHHKPVPRSSDATASCYASPGAAALLCDTHAFVYALPVVKRPARAVRVLMV